MKLATELGVVRVALRIMLGAAMGAMVVAFVGVLPSLPGTALADPLTQGVIARETFACHSPWQVLEGRECRKLPAGVQVDIVSGDDFFACIVWPDTQRCMWVARDALRRR